MEPACLCLEGVRLGATWAEAGVGHLGCTRQTLKSLGGLDVQVNRATVSSLLGKEEGVSSGYLQTKVQGSGVQRQVERADRGGRGLALCRVHTHRGGFCCQNRKPDLLGAKSWACGSSLPRSSPPGRGQRVWPKDATSPSMWTPDVEPGPGSSHLKGGPL